MFQTQVCFVSGRLLQGFDFVVRASGPINASLVMLFSERATRVALFVVWGLPEVSFR